MKKAALMLAIATFTGLAAAQAQLDVGPGMVGPGSPIYGLEVAWDNAAMSIGLKKAGEVAQERAAEARAAMERNNTQAAQRAANEMSEVAQRASSNDTQGLQKAEAVLQEVIANAPQAAQQGLQTALDNVRRAVGNIPEGAGPGNQTGPGGQPEPDEGAANGMEGVGTSANQSGQQDSGTGETRGNQSPDTPVQNQP